MMELGINRDGCRDDTAHTGHSGVFRKEVEPGGMLPSDELVVLKRKRKHPESPTLFSLAHV